MTRTDYLRALTARFGYNTAIPAEFMTAGELLEILEEMEELKYGTVSQDYDRDDYRAGCVPDGNVHRDCIDCRHAVGAAAAIATDCHHADIFTQETAQ
jgi:hypothetical protein